MKGRSDAVVRLGQYLTLALTFMITSACSGGHFESTGATATVSAPPLSTARPTELLPASGRRTTVEFVNTAIIAAEHRDAGELYALIAPYACPRLIVIPCPPTGKVVGSAGCQGAFDPYDSPTLKIRINRWVEEVDPMVYAVSAQGASGVPEVPGEYLIVFKSGHALEVTTASITYLYFPCGSLDSWIQENAPILLPPLP